MRGTNGRNGGDSMQVAAGEEASVSRSAREWTVRIAAVIACLSLALDRYSWGEYGVAVGTLGPTVEPVTAWQPIAAIVVALAVTASAAAVKARVRLALGLGVCGALVFMLANSILLIRDGGGRLVSYEYVVLAPGRFLILGAAAISALLYGLVRLVRGRAREEQVKLAATDR